MKEPLQLSCCPACTALIGILLGATQCLLAVAAVSTQFPFLLQKLNKSSISHPLTWAGKTRMPIAECLMCRGRSNRPILSVIITSPHDTFTAQRPGWQTGLVRLHSDFNHQATRWFHRVRDCRRVILGFRLFEHLLIRKWRSGGPVSAGAWEVTLACLCFVGRPVQLCLLGLDKRERSYWFYNEGVLFPCMSTTNLYRAGFVD